MGMRRMDSKWFAFEEQLNETDQREKTSVPEVSLRERSQSNTVVNDSR